MPELIDICNLTPKTLYKILSENFCAEYWIKTAEPGTEWLMPAEAAVPAIPAINIAVKFNPADKYELLQNGEPVSPLFNFGTIKNKASTVARVYWKGIHIKAGENKF